MDWIDWIDFTFKALSIILVSIMIVGAVYFTQASKRFKVLGDKINKDWDEEKGA